MLINRVLNFFYLKVIADYFNEDIDWLIGRTDVRIQKVSFSDLPISQGAFKVLIGMGLAKCKINSAGETVIDIDKKDIDNLFHDTEAQQNYLDSCLNKTLPLFLLPIEAKNDLANAILSIAIKYGVFPSTPECDG